VPSVRKLFREVTGETSSTDVDVQLSKLQGPILHKLNQIKELDQDMKQLIFTFYRYCSKK